MPNPPSPKKLEIPLCPSTAQYNDEFSYGDDDIKKISELFPENVKIPDDVPLVGGKLVPIRAHVSDILKDIKDAADAAKGKAFPVFPLLKARFSVNGNCDDYEALTIELASSAVKGNKGGSFKIAGVGVSITIDATISSEHYDKEKCEKPAEKDCERKTRNFHVVWEATVTCNPGPTQTIDLAEYDLIVSACCCCFDEDEDEDDQEKDEGEEEENGDDERQPGIPLVLTVQTAAQLVTQPDDDDEDEEKKKKADKERFDKMKLAKKKAKEEKNQKKVPSDPKSSGGQEHTKGKSRRKRDKHQRGLKRKRMVTLDKKRRRFHRDKYAKDKRRKPTPSAPPKQGEKRTLKPYRPRLPKPPTRPTPKPKDEEL